MAPSCLMKSSVVILAIMVCALFAGLMFMAMADSGGSTPLTDSKYLESGLAAMGIGGAVGLVFSPVLLCKNGLPEEGTYAATIMYRFTGAFMLAAIGMAVGFGINHGCAGSMAGFGIGTGAGVLLCFVLPAIYDVWRTGTPENPKKPDPPVKSTREGYFPRSSSSSDDSEQKPESPSAVEQKPSNPPTKRIIGGALAGASVGVAVGLQAGPWAVPAAIVGGIGGALTGAYTGYYMASPADDAPTPEKPTAAQPAADPVSDAKASAKANDDRRRLMRRLLKPTEF